MFGETADGELVEFWPMRTTAARSLRVGDQLRISTGAHTGYRAIVTQIDENEEARMLTLHGRLQSDEGLLFRKDAYPNEMFERLAKPGEPPQGGESRMIYVEELWKWLGVEMNDPEHPKSGNKFILTNFRRIHSEDTGSEAIELRIRGKTNSQELRTLHMTPRGTVGFKGHR